MRLTRALQGHPDRTVGDCHGLGGEGLTQVNEGRESVSAVQARLRAWVTDSRRQFNGNQLQVVYCKLRDCGCLSSDLQSSEGKSNNKKKTVILTAALEVSHSHSSLYFCGSHLGTAFARSCCCCCSVEGRRLFIHAGEPRSEGGIV